MKPIGSNRPNVRRKAHWGMTVALVLCLSVLPACSHEEGQVEVAKPLAAERAGDSALPALDGEYAYILAKVLSKDADADIIEVEVIPWNDERPFVKSGLEEGSTGAVLCSELVFFPAGIGVGSTVVVCCLAGDGDELPVTAYAIEKLDLFEERVER